MASPFDISNAELEVLKILWRNAPQHAVSIVTQLQEQHAWTNKTIKTMLNRLVGKGAVTFQRDGRAYLYSPAIDEQEYQAQVSSRMVKKVFSGSFSALVSGFAQKSELRAEDVSALKALIAEWEKENSND